NGLQLQPPAGAGATGDHNLVSPNTHPAQVPGDTIDCDAKLQPLADNGGPTRTIALGAGSCAIDAGPVLPSAPTDQRGRGPPRPSVTAPDLAAFDAQPAARLFYDGFDV